MTDLSAILTPAGLKAWVWDPQHGRIDIVTGGGAVMGWSLEQKAYTLNLTVGGTPNSVDISADGRFLLIGNNDTTVSGATATASITRVNLAASTFDRLSIPLSSPRQLGVLDLATGAGGDVLFTRQSAQAGFNPYEQVAIDAANPAPQPVAALANLAPGESLIRSNDHRYIVLQQTGVTNAPMQLYDTTTAALAARTDTDSVAVAHGDVSPAAGLVAAVSINGVSVYDLNLRLVRDLSSFQGGGDVVGATFTDDGHQLLVWKAPFALFGGSANVTVLDTATWRQVGAFSPTLATSSEPGTGASLGQMEVAGHVLVMDNGGRLELVDLAARMSLTVTGDAQDESLWGSVGTDSLSGGGGRDILNGGEGADTLAGGAGADIFRIAPGASLASGMDVVTDWEAGDVLAFGGGAATAATYIEASASGFAAARALADQQIAGGTVDYVAVAAGGDVYVFADSRGDNGGADDVVRLAGRGLGDIDAQNIASSPSQGGSGGLTLPPTPPVPTGGARAFVVGDMDAAHLSDLLPAVLNDASETAISIGGAGNLGLTVGGEGFRYVNDQLVGGVAHAFSFSDARTGGQLVLRFTADHVSVAANQLTPWLAADATQTAFSTILAGSDVIGGSPDTDVIRGYAGDDLIYGLGGGDTMWGGTGNDILYVRIPASVTDLPFGGRIGATGSTYLRGEEGDDFIVGGDGFDDINGNMGSDTGSGGLGDDWVVGGKDGDLLFGDAGNDLVYGNLGADTCDGGAGSDTVRGGQDDDVVRGGDGADFVSGDRGSDTLTGGAGADIFHSFAEAGIDRVTDFNRAEGDRVLLDGGTQYTVAQVGADIVISMSAGQMILVGVQLSTLAEGWISVG